MARKSARAGKDSGQGRSAWDEAAGDGAPDDSGYEADVAPRRPVAAATPDAESDAGGDERDGRRLDTVAGVLAALPPGDAGRTLKLALLDAIEAGARADRIALPLEVQGLRARVRAGTA